MDHYISFAVLKVCKLKQLTSPSRRIINKKQLEKYTSIDIPKECSFKGECISLFLISLYCFNKQCTVIP